MEWSIAEIARLAGTTSRTLRHYGDVGLLVPSRIGAGGYRFYDEAAITRLQRILLLRDLGLGIPAIADLFAEQSDTVSALSTHLHLLDAEKVRLDRQIAAVALTIQKLKNGDQLMPQEVFDGFDHTVHQAEVTERWGADAYARGDAWWRAMSAGDRRAFQDQHRQIAADYQAARDAGEAPESERVQGIVARHVDWLGISAGVTGGQISAQRLRNYGDMYVGDPRFAANYGGLAGAQFVRSAFDRYAQHKL